jgi:type IV secretory pathway VirB10-like protein
MIQVAAIATAGLLLAGGVGAFVGRSSTPPPPPPQAAQPAVDISSTAMPLVVSTPFVAVVRASVASQIVARQVPLLASTPVPRATPAQVAQAAAAPVVVPRVMTSAEVASSSRMDLGTSEAPAAQGTTATEEGDSSPSVVSPPAHPANGPHSSFFAAQSDAVGYAPEDGKCIVRATTAISARIETAVDSTLPAGVVAARIVTPVDCSNGAEAIPAGAILQGTFDSSTTSGESRLLVVFNHIIFPPTDAHPNGRNYAIGTQSATGPQGETGMGGRVSSGLGKAFGTAVVYTLLQAAGNAISHNSSILGGSSVASQVPPPQQQRPTIYASPGDPVDVVLNRDLSMDPWK